MLQGSKLHWTIPVFGVVSSGPRRGSYIAPLILHSRAPLYHFETKGTTRTAVYLCRPDFSIRDVLSLHFRVF